MTLPHSIPVVAGALALFATSALVAVHAILAWDVEATASAATHNAALAGAILESGCILLLVALLVTVHLRKRIYQTVPQNNHNEKLPPPPPQSRSSRGLWSGLGIFLCTVAAAVSVAALACLRQAMPRLSQTPLGSGAGGFLAGGAVTLAICYGSQLLFFVMQFLVVPAQPGHDAPAEPLHVADSMPSLVKKLSLSPSPRIPSIHYRETGPLPLRVRPEKTTSTPHRAAAAAAAAATATATATPLSPPGSSSGHSAAETMNSLRSSLSSAIRPMSSKTRLLPAGGSSSQRSSRYSASHSHSATHSLSHPPSPPSAHPELRRSAEDDFDSWDTSSVSTQNRQAVLGSMVPATVTMTMSNRFLETIPASPTASRSPSPGRPLDLEPPKMRRRSRSYSPSPRPSRSTSALASSSASASSIRAPAAAVTRTRSYSHTQASEAHIHPLFRSDSPTPPPAFSAGTVVTAAPQAGQVLTTDIHSLRTLSRMRSGSLPVVPSPLSRQGSFDDFHGRKTAAISTSSSRCSSSHGVPADVREEDEETEGYGKPKRWVEEEERKMTPPIPDWILSAGARTSLDGYENRRVPME